MVRRLGHDHFRAIPVPCVNHLASRRPARTSHKEQTSEGDGVCTWLKPALCTRRLKTDYAKEDVDGCGL